MNVHLQTIVNNPAEIFPTLSPKFNNPTDRPPKTTVKFNQDRKVRSFAKNTLGSYTFSEIGISERGGTERGGRGCVYHSNWESDTLVLLAL